MFDSDLTQQKGGSLAFGNHGIWKQTDCWEAIKPLRKYSVTHAASSQQCSLSEETSSFRWLSWLFSPMLFCCIKFIHSQKRKSCQSSAGCARRTANVWPGPSSEFCSAGIASPSVNSAWSDLFGSCHPPRGEWLAQTWLNSPRVKAESKHTFKINSNLVQIVTRESKQTPPKNVLKILLEISSSLLTFNSTSHNERFL